MLTQRRCVVASGRASSHQGLSLARPRCCLKSARPHPRSIPGNFRSPVSASAQNEAAEPEAEEGQGELFTRYCFEGLLVSSLTVGAANILGQSSAWSWDFPSNGLETMLACALVPTVMLLVICVPPYKTERVATDEQFLEDTYNRAASQLVLVVGDDEENEKQMAVNNEVKPQTFTTALSIIQTFLARPWSSSRPLPIAGFLVKQTMTQAALECMLRGTLVLGLQSNIKETVAQADSSSWLFWIKFFGLANEGSALAAAVILATVLLTPFTLFQTKSVQQFARAVVNKPVRDQGLAAMASSASLAEFSQQIQALSDSTGTPPATLSALLANAELPKPAASQGRGQQANASGSAAEAGPAPAVAMVGRAGGVEEGAPAASSLAKSSTIGGGAGFDSAPGISPAASGPGSVSGEGLTQLQQAEVATTAAFAALKAAKTPDEIEASSLALLDAANRSGEVAMLAIVEASVKQKGELSNKTVAAMASIQALRESQRRMKAEATEVKLAEDEDSRESEFQALIRVQTPEDKLVGQLLGTHLMACMVAVNAAFLVTGSLAVSFGTACLVRVMPSLVVEVTRQLREDAWEGSGEA